MNNIETLTCCRGCAGTNLKKVWTAPPLPIHLWPLPKGAPSIDQPTSVFVCQDCGLAQLNDMSVEFVETLYDKGVCVFDEQGQQDLRKSLVTDWAGEDFFKNKKILELGGGNNPFLRYVPEARERWIADLNPQSLSEDSADHVIAGNFETIDLPGAHFDIVCGYLVWEHFINPLAVTKQIARSLSDDGLLIVEVPNLHWLRHEHPHYLVFHQHQSIFTIETLDYMMAVAGLERRAQFADNHVVYAAYARNAGVVPTMDEAVVGLAEKEVLETAQILESVDFHVCNHTPIPGWERPSLYGAGGSMSLFLAYTPHLRARLTVAFDNDPRKTGHVVPGTSAHVRAPEAIAASDTDGALILGNFMLDLGIADQFLDHVTVTEILAKLNPTDN